MKNYLLILLFFVSSPLLAQSEEKINKQVEADYEYLEKLYKHLHLNPELSFHEKESSARMAKELRSLGFEVTENIGGYGVVGVLKNGEGKTIWVRTDTDALPILEATGLPYASTAKGKADDGTEVPVMHGCGHDMHMTVWTGVARMMAKMKKDWKGTIVMLAQPAEERGSGARMMLEDKLFERFPKPDYCLALHVSASLEAGKVGYCAGPALASVDMVDITVYGQGGHGAYPHTTIDPVVLASRMVLDFQTIVSREISPLEPAVVTVGSIHGGTKHNIISGEVKMQLTLRSYSDDVRQHTLKALERISKGVALSAGLPEDKMPKIVVQNESIPSTYNTPELAEKAGKSFVKAIGEDNVVGLTPVMGGEDFGMYGKTPEKFPILIYWLGTVSAEKMKESKEKGTQLPSLHSAYFAPDPKPSIKTGVKTMSQAVLDLLNEK